ncbi:MAG TPA: Hsp70 family protein [Acidimicrobiales bacterium]
MGYSLGIDIGATTCAAAMRHGAALEARPLGERGTTMPAVALPRPDGSTLVGEAADRHSAYEPTLVARMIAARLDDAEPVVIDGTPHDPLTLTEALIGTVIDRATPESGDAPDRVVVTYPLRGGDAAEVLLAVAAARAIGGAATLVPEPIAAVAKLARERDLGDDVIVAVVDFGGSSVDVTLVHRTPEAIDLVSDPASLPDLGGVDLDAAMLSLVEGAIGDVTSTINPDDRAGMAALRRLRASCREAKERLSVDHAAVVDVALPHARGRVEVTREAFERAVEPQLAEAVELVLATIGNAGLIPSDVSLALLTGGSARVPTLARLVAERTGLPIVVDHAPELTTALGAALFADVAAAPAGGPPEVPSDVPPAPVLLPGFGAEPTEVGAPLPAVPPPAPALPGALDPEPAAFTGGPLGFDTGPQPLAADPYDTGPTAFGTAAYDTGPQPLASGPHSYGSGPVPLAAGPPADDWPAPDGNHADDPWDPVPADGWQGADNLWDDQRTSVFDPPPAPDLPPPEPVAEWGQPTDEEFQRLRTSDTDPFVGRGTSLSSRLRERRDDWSDDDDGPGPLDMRLVVGGIVAAVLVVIVGGYALLSGTGAGDDPGIAVAGTSASTSSTTEPTTTSTTAPTTTESTTTTTEEETTTTEWRPPATTATTAPPTTTTPPTTRPSTTRPPNTTTTTAPTTTTTAPTTTTTACSPPPQCI